MHRREHGVCTRSGLEDGPGSSKVVGGWPDGTQRSPGRVQGAKRPWECREGAQGEASAHLVDSVDSSAVLSLELAR